MSHCQHCHYFDIHFLLRSGKFWRPVLGLKHENETNTMRGWKLVRWENCGRERFWDDLSLKARDERIHVPEVRKLWKWKRRSSCIRVDAEQAGGGLTVPADSEGGVRWRLRVGSGCRCSARGLEDSWISSWKLDARCWTDENRVFSLTF